MLPGRNTSQLLDAAPSFSLYPPADLGFRLFGALDFGEPSTEGIPIGAFSGPTHKFA